MPFCNSLSLDIININVSANLYQNTSTNSKFTISWDINLCVQEIEPFSLFFLQNFVARQSLDRWTECQISIFWVDFANIDVHVYATVNCNYRDIKNSQSLALNNKRHFSISALRISALSHFAVVVNINNVYPNFYQNIPNGLPIIDFFTNKAPFFFYINLQKRIGDEIFTFFSSKFDTRQSLDQ